MVGKIVLYWIGGKGYPAIVLSDEGDGEYLVRVFNHGTDAGKADTNHVAKEGPPRTDGHFSLV